MGQHERDSRKCEDCYHWDGPHERVYPTYAYMLPSWSGEIETYTTGYCKAHPSAVAPEKEPENWCGEFTPAPDWETMED